MSSKALDQVDRLNVAGIALLDQGHLEEALAYFERALELVSSAGPGSAQEANTLNSIGRVLEEKGQFEGALSYFVRALEISLAVAPPGLQTATQLNNVGRVYQERGDLGKALGYFERARAILDEVAPTLESAAVYNNIGLIHQRHGDLGRALECFTRALSIVEAAQRGSEPSEESAHCLSSIASVYVDEGDPARALRYAERALAISESVAPNSLMMVRRLNQVGELSWTMESHADAVRLFERALRVAQAAAPGSTYEASARDNLGHALLENGEDGRALTEFERALDLFQGLAGRSFGAAESMKDIAMVHLGRKEYRRAQAWFGQALEICESTQPRSELTVTILSGLGVARFVDGDLDGAIQSLQRAVEAIEGRRGAASPGTSRDLLFGGSQSSFQWLTLALLRRGHRQDAALAFGYAERSRARALIDLLAERSVTLSGQTPEQQQLVDEDERLKRELASLHRRLVEQRCAGGPPAELDGLADQERELENGLDGVARAMRETFPEYAALKYPVPATLAEAQTALDPATLLLEFSVYQDVVFAWAVRTSECLFRSLNISGTELGGLIDAAIGSYRTGTPRSTEPPADFIRASQALAAELISWLPQSSIEGVQRLIVVPDGALHYLPFELLPDPDDSGGLLLDRFSISYAPSLTVLKNLAELWSGVGRASGRELLVFAPFADDGDVGSAGLEALPYTRAEAQWIVDGFADGAVAYTGVASTELRVKAESPGYRYVHFATHGLFDDVNPLYSSLMLAPPGADRSEAADDRLEVWEMFGLKLSAELVVCSACETGRGQIRAGEGLVGISRALFFAGARCVVVSLWPVNDASTARVMRAMYAELRAGRSVSEALRSAKTLERAQRADPYYWAPFVALGLSDQTRLETG